MAQVKCPSCSRVICSCDAPDCLRPCSFEGPYFCDRCSEDHVPAGDGDLI